MNYFIKLYGTTNDPINTWHEGSKQALFIADVSDRAKRIAQKVKKGDRFVIYFVPRRFMGVQIVTKELECNRCEGRFPHVIEVMPYLGISFLTLAKRFRSAKSENGKISLRIWKAH